jgi:HEPN domain-containing protein/predicted nucleotidyltransferase
MLKNLRDVKQKLIHHYDPERIILYGSYGTKKANKDSDIDLLIIKNTDKGPMERQIEVEKILSDRLIPLDIKVFTSQEVRFLFSLGSPFIEEVVEKGRLLYMRKATFIWVKEAEEELESAVILFEHKKFKGTCYHCQQCVEKGLKALIIEKGKKPGRIHDIVELFNTVTTIGYNIPLTMDDAIFLNSIYRSRYPTEEGLLPHGEPTPEDTQRAVTVSEELLKTVKTVLRNR